MSKEHIKVVFFDLDDTLFDHKFSRQQGLLALQERFSELGAVSLEELESEHEKLLSDDYGQELDGKISIVDGTTQRITKLCALYGLNLSLLGKPKAPPTYTVKYMEKTADLFQA